MSARHTVSSGERLSAIAARYRVPVAQILAANPQKARLTLLGGVEVFRDLAEGETLALPQRTVTQQLRDAGPPACPPGTELDATKQFCLNPTRMPPSPPCAPGMSPDFFTQTYCEDPAHPLLGAYETCAVTSPSGGGSYSGAYLPTFGLCMPTDFTGGDPMPMNATCSRELPFYDKTTGMCHAPGSNAPAPMLPMCFAEGQKWDVTKNACVDASAPTRSSGGLWNDPKPLLVALGVAAVAAVAVTGAVLLAKSQGARAGKQEQSA